MRILRSVVAALTIATFPLVAAPALAITTQKRSLGQLVADADHIVRAVVISKASAWGQSPSGRPHIFSTYHFSAVEVAKGALSEFDLRIAGGSVGDMTEWVEDGVTFMVGDEGILFLSGALPELFAGRDGVVPVRARTVDVDGQKIDVTDFIGKLKQEVRDPHVSILELPGLEGPVAGVPREALADETQGRLVRRAEELSAEEGALATGIARHANNAEDIRALERGERAEGEGLGSPSSKDAYQALSPGAGKVISREAIPLALTATIYDTWWTNAVDQDGDGYVRSANLNIDADVVGGTSSLTVFFKLYYKLASSSSWTLLSTSGNFTITGQSSSDYITWPLAGGSKNLYDWKVEVYRSGQSIADNTRDPSNDSDLNDYKMETAAEDTPVSLTATIYDTWWTNAVDQDGDGYVRSANLNIDADVVGGTSSLTVFFKLYYKLASSSSWTLLSTSGNFTITGQSSSDYITWPLAGGSKNLYDWKVEVYRSGQSIADNTRDPSNDSDLNDYKMETAAEDTPPVSPVISSISPTKGPGGTGSQITISGSGFGASQGSGRVEFFFKAGEDRLPANIVSWTDTSIVCVIAPFNCVTLQPPLEGCYPTEGSSGPVRVVTGGGQTSNEVQFEVSFGFMGSRWPGTSPIVTYRIDSTFPAGLVAGIQNAFTTWSTNTGITFLYGGEIQTPHTDIDKDDETEVIWGEDSATICGNADAIACANCFVQGGATLRDCDIYFNSGFPFSSANPTPTGAFDAETIMLHESGHWLMLADLYGSIDTPKVMYGINNGGPSWMKRALQPDDRAGGQWIYGGSVSNPSITSAVVSPTVLNKYESFTIQYTVNSGVAMPVILGASLRPAGTTPWSISDPARDITVSIPVGASVHSRFFALGTSIASGFYDLAVALWRDQNGDGVIDAGDQQVSFKEYPSKIQVVDCSYGILTNTRDFASSGGTDTVTVESNFSSCPWTAVSNNPSWIRITAGSSGSGNGSVSYLVEPNSGAARTGTMTIEGNIFTVTQQGGIAPPVVTTGSASGISATGATLNGTVNPNGSATSGWFQWGTTMSYGNTTGSQSLGSGTSGVAFSTTVSLQCNTPYHFRAVGQNSGGTVYGNDASFTTSACPTTPPTVTTSAGSGISATGATLNGTVNPNGSATSGWFQWGMTTSYGNTTGSQSLGSGTSGVALSSAVPLQCNTPYHFRAVGQNSGGTVYGNDASFTTSACPTTPPTVTTGSASGISATGATLNGTVNPNGSATSGWFQWGMTTSYGNTTGSQSLGSGTSGVALSSAVPLQCNTPYHFRAVGQNSGGTVYGNDASFTTSACPGTQPTVLLFKQSSADATVDYFRNLLTTNGIAFTELTASQVPTADLSKSVMVAGFSSEPTEFSTVASQIATAVNNGSALISEGFGGFLLGYAGIGSAAGGSWNPMVHDTGAFVKPINASPLFDGIATWDPPTTPDRPEQYINYLVNPTPLATCNYSPPSTGVELIHFWGLGITYGWAGQSTDSSYCLSWGGCTPERSVADSYLRVIHYGAGRILTSLDGVGVQTGIHQLGPVADRILKNFILLGPPAQHNGEILLTGGTLAGQSLSGPLWQVTVVPGAQISGTVQLQTNNTMSANAVAPFGYTWTWGDRAVSIVQVSGNIPTGQQAWNVSVDLAAPSAPGVYYVLFGFNGEMNLSEVLSCTNWTVSSPVWNDGNDYFDIGALQLSGAQAYGYVPNWPYKFPNGFTPFDIPVAPIRVMVTAPGTFPLSVTKAGTGTGTVTSTPVGINCGSTCSASFPVNSGVTLTASPAGGSTFAGWSGEGCSGTSTCQVTLSQARAVTATFGLGGSAATFFPITPCRVLDTRSTAPPILAAGSRRVFTVAGTCGVPTGAKAIVSNLTVVGAGAQGELRVIGGHLTSTFTSAISFPPSRARANNAIVQLATDGSGTISVINNSAGTVHFILDVNGYFQ